MILSYTSSLSLIESSSSGNKDVIMQIMKRIKILFVSHEANLIGGAEKSLLNIVMYLNTRPDIEVVVATGYTGNLTKRLKSEGIKTVSAPYRWAIHYPRDPSKSILKQSLASLGRIQKILQQEKPDVVVTNTSVVPWFAYVARGLGIPHIWFIREHLGKDHGIPIYPDLGTSLKFINAFSDSIMTNSQYMKKYYEGVLDRSDIKVVYPSVDKDILKYAPQDREKESGKMRFIIYGGILPIKNQLEALKAVRMLYRKYPEIELSIMGFVGDSDYYDKLVSFVAKNDLKKVVSFLPHSKNPYKTVAHHDICIVPSVHEPFGRVTVEAMLLKKVVIASNSGGNTELIKESGHANQLLYKPGSAKDLAGKMEFYLKNPGKVQQDGNSLQKFAIEQFISEKQLSDFYDIVKRVAAIKKEPVTDWISDMLTGQQLLFESEMRRLHNEIHKRDLLIQSITNSKRWKYSSRMAKAASPIKRIVKKSR